MHKGVVSIVVGAALVVAQASAGSCERPGVAFAVQTAALQQEMMVAALQCQDVDSYNDFVQSHQIDLELADRMLQDYFKSLGPKTGYEEFNHFKTELANSSSRHFTNDPQFCGKLNADFKTAHDRKMYEILAEIPFTVETGTIGCEWSDRPAPETPTVTADASLPQ